MIRGRARTLRRIDTGAIGKLMAAARSLRAGQRVTVGVHEDRGAEEHRGPSKGVSVVDVAVLTEFGPTAWLRPTVDGERDQIQHRLLQAAKRALKSARFGRGTGNEVERAFGRVAEQVAARMRARLRRQGLVATGHLEESVEGRVGPMRGAA